MRLQTLLKGPCTDDVEVQSDWIYATFQVPPQGQEQPGVPGAVLCFVFSNLESNVDNTLMFNCC